MSARIVIDTNVYVSFLLGAGSVPAQAVERGWRVGHPLISHETWTELRIVLSRPRLSKFLTPDSTKKFLDNIWEISERVSIPTSVRACRDPRDDKFLELAVHGRAEFIITGDQDLLALNPFRGIAILTPADFLAHVADILGA
jgi:putative PIN family toxin of toxin-antitoxin system